MTQTIFEYLYRDASNYKAHGAVLLSGRLDDAAERKIRDQLSADPYFVASELGVPDLRSELWKYSGGCPNEDDHLWHEFVRFGDANLTDVQTLNFCGSVDDFVARILVII
ncbi:MAG: hypothetical protein V4441_12265 [Pseudomonadota bacterium]